MLQQGASGRISPAEFLLLQYTEHRTTALPECIGEPGMVFTNRQKPFGSVQLMLVWEAPFGPCNYVPGEVGGGRGGGI